MEKSLKTAINIRKFNRFYLPYFHLLTQKYLNTEYSMTEARILYEIYESEEICARDIVRSLHVDKSYLSRILKKFESQFLLKRRLSPDSSRLMLISLTKKGRTLTESLIADSNYQVRQYITRLSDSDLDNLSYHLEQITKILGGCKDEHR